MTSNLGDNCKQMEKSSINTISFLGTSSLSSLHRQEVKSNKQQKFFPLCIKYVPSLVLSAKHLPYALQDHPSARETPASRV